MNAEKATHVIAMLYAPIHQEVMSVDAQQVDNAPQLVMWMERRRNMDPAGMVKPVRHAHVW